MVRVRGRAAFRLARRFSVPAAMATVTPRREVGVAGVVVVVVFFKLLFFFFLLLLLFNFFLL